MDLALNNLQRLVCYKLQTNMQYGLNPLLSNNCLRLTREPLHHEMLTKVNQILKKI